jgi:hypothetical protein
MPNPLIDQGILNRLRGAVTVTNAPELNVTAPFLARAGIRLSLEGETSTGIPTMTGVVQSPEPFQMAMVTVALLRSQGLGNLYKQRMERNVLLGPVVVRPDSTALGRYYFENCSIASIGELPFDGADPAMAVTIRGIYYLNSALWNAA